MAFVGREGSKTFVASGLPTSGDCALGDPPADQRAIEVALPAGAKNWSCSCVEALAGGLDTTGAAGAGTTLTAITRFRAN